MKFSIGSDTTAADYEESLDAALAEKLDPTFLKKGELFATGRRLAPVLASTFGVASAGDLGREDAKKLKRDLETMMSNLFSSLVFKFSNLIDRYWNVQTTPRFPIFHLSLP